MLAKGFQIEPLVYLSLIVSLILLRIPVSGLLTRFRAADSA
jgi:sulfoxide reductase heme-binding subunit YedZ